MIYWKVKNKTYTKFMIDSQEKIKQAVDLLIVNCN